jgi:DNA replication protein DnaC
MAYNKTAYTNAERELARRKERAEAAAAAHFAEVAALCPELRQIDEMMKQSIMSLTKLIFEDKNAAHAKIETIRTEHENGVRLRERILRENGFPSDYLDTKYVCEKCHDSGFTDGIRCECFINLINKYTLDELNKSANLPECEFGHFSTSYYSGKTRSGYDIRTIMENYMKSAVDYAEHFTQSADSLLIYGKTGLGKTHISLSIAKKVIEKGYSVAYNSIINLLNSISREKFDRSLPDGSDTEKAVLDVDLLVIDDLGSEYDTPYLESIIYNIVNTRMNLGKPTIINCNLENFDELRERYSDRVVSRIAAYYKRMHFVGADIRQLRRKNLS